MFIETVLAWLWVPALLLALCFGAGLVVERVARFDLPNGLLAPVGFAAVVLLATGAYQLGASTPVVLALLVATATAGALVDPGSLGARLRIGWGPAGAALAVYALYMAPVVLSGGWTWTGYNYVNDTALHLLLADHIFEHGPVVVGGPETTGSELVRFNLSDRYPYGPHALLATLHLGSGTPLAAAYQPFISMMAALAAMSLGTLARMLGLRSMLAAALALVSLAGNLAYQQAMQGAIKEIGVICLISAAGALAWALIDAQAKRADAVSMGRHDSAGGFAVMGLVLIAIVPVYSVGGGGFLVAFLGVTGAIWLVRRVRGAGGRRRPSKRRIALITLAPIVIAAPLLPGVIEFATGTLDDFGSSGGSRTAELGNLIAPLEIWQSAGVWFNQDYRRASDLPWLNYVAIAGVLVLFATGLFHELRSRRFGSLLYAAPVVAVLALTAPALSPYIDAKLYAIITPAVIFVAGIGAMWLATLRPAVLRIGAPVLAGALAISILASDALAYRAVRLAPTDRLQELETTARHLKGGPWLLNEWEEFAKVFMRDTRVNVANEDYSPRPAVYRKSSLPAFGYYYDLDQFDTGYLQDFPGIVYRRSPSASRPPTGFHKVYENDLYEVWKRRGADSVVEHLTGGDVLRAASIPGCRAVRDIADRVGPGERLVAAVRPETVVMDLTPRVPRSWRKSNSEALTWVPGGPAYIRQPVEVGGGSYRVWARGSFGRPVTALVDGRKVGKAEGLNAPGQWLEVGRVRLEPGVHELGLRRGGGSLAPGNDFAGLVGPIALEKVGEQKLLTIKPSDAASLCERPVDWIERVR